MEFLQKTENWNDTIHFDFLSKGKNKYKFTSAGVIEVPELADKFYEFMNKNSFPINKNLTHNYIEYKNTFILCTKQRHDHAFDLSFLTNNLSEINEIINLFNNYNELVYQNKIRINSLDGAPGRIDINRLYTSEKSFSYLIPEFYPDIDIVKLTEQFYNASERLLILYGTPGTGKTTLIKYIASVFNDSKNRTRYSDADIAYSKNKQLISSSDFWSSVTGNYKLVILDDLDIDFSDRKDQNNQFTTNLLSSSDGIFGSLAPKVIISTNQTITDIDAALVRPGRCFDFIELKPMTYDYAFDLWVNLLNQDPNLFKENFSQGEEIFQSALYSLYKEAISRENVRSYMRNHQGKYSIYAKLREMNISVSSDKQKKFI